jgi:hypothetical protein
VANRGSRPIYRRGRAGGWWGNQHAKLIFERGLSSLYPGTTGRSAGTCYEYRSVVQVHGYGPRCARIEVHGDFEPCDAAVFVDGPAESPHRYASGALCMWHPTDPPERRWIARQGLVALLDLAVLHLFREAYWHEVRVWPGDQAPHTVRD